MRRRGRGHVPRENGHIRIAVPDRLHLLQHAGAVTVGRIDHDQVHLRVPQRVDPLKHILRHAHRRAAKQAAVFILGAVGILGGLLDILDGNQAPEHPVPVHDRKLLDAVSRQDGLRFLQRRSDRRRDQVVFGHHLADRLGVIRFKPQIPVGQNADQLSFPGNGNAADAVPAHQLLRVADQVLRAEEKRIGNHAVLAALYLIHLGRLLLNGHVLMDDPQTAFPRHGNRHTAVRHGIHGGAHHRNIQSDVLRQLDGKIHIPWQHFTPGRDQQHVVKGQSLSDSLLQHSVSPPSD